MKKKCVELAAYNPNVLRVLMSLKLVEKDIPALSEDKVLIKIAASPCNPSDIAFLQGGYNVVKELPAVPGFECTGTIIDAGAEARHLIGKRVSCFSQAEDDGTWADHLLTSYKSCFVLKDEMSDEQAACFAINPFTAYGLFEIALQRETQAIIQNAAGSQVCRTLSFLAKKHNIKVINIVRKQDHIKLLQDAGEEYVLNQNDDQFESDLNKLTQDLNATLAYDAVAGELSGQMYNAMPNDAELVIYGGLSGKPVNGLDVLDTIFQNKLVSGFDLNTWLKENEDTIESISSELQDYFISGELKTAIQAETTLDNILGGLKHYLKNMSSGKVLIKP